MGVTVEIKSSSRYPIRRREIREVIKKTLESYEIQGEVAVEINIIGDRKMTKLHIDYLDLPGTTDVLSFPLQEGVLEKGEDDFAKSEGVLRLGTIFLSYPQAQKQANAHYLTTDEEIKQLIEHGMLHLLGIHHE